MRYYFELKRIVGKDPAPSALVFDAADDGAAMDKAIELLRARMIVTLSRLTPVATDVELVPKGGK